MDHQFDPADNCNPSDNSNSSDDESKDGKIVSNVDSTIIIDRKQGIDRDYSKLQGAEIVKDTPKRPTPIQGSIVTITKTNRMLSKSKFFCYIVMQLTSNITFRYHPKPACTFLCICSLLNILCLLIILCYCHLFSHRSRG